MSEVTDWIGAIGGAVGALSAVWGIMTAAKADKAKGEAEAAKAAATKAVADSTKAIADSTKAVADSSRAIADSGKAIADADRAMVKAEEAQTKTQVGWLELQLRVFLSSRRDKIHDVAKDLEAIRNGRKMEDLTPLEKEHIRDAFLRFESAHEDFLGALEQACRHYRDRKVDAEAFKRMYDEEIREVIECDENNPFYKFVYPEKISKYSAIWATYSDWFGRKEHAVA